MTRLQGILLLGLVTLLALPVTARAENCGENAPGAATLQFQEDGQPLYEATFTGRNGTIACFRLLKEQYSRKEAIATPEGVAPWLGSEGPLNLVSTWDTFYLPFSSSFPELTVDVEVRRKLQEPTVEARLQGWKAGMWALEGANAGKEDFNPDTAKPLSMAEAYALDPIYSLVHSSDDELVYVWPDPEADKSSVFIERRFRKAGDYRLEMLVTVYNFSTGRVVHRPQFGVDAYPLPGNEPTGFLAPPANVFESMCMTQASFHREDSSALEKKPEGETFGEETLWVGVGDRYFLKALIPRDMKGFRCHLYMDANKVINASLFRDSSLAVGPGPESCFPSWHPAIPADGLSCLSVAQELGVSEGDVLVAHRLKAAIKARQDALSAGNLERYGRLLASVEAYAGWVTYTFEMYLGPKDISELQKAVVGLEDSIDFWVLGFLAKPMLHILRWFHSVIPHWAIAIILLTILVKLLLLPVTQRSYKQMQRMSSLRPLMDEVKKKYGNDKERLNQELMNLYKREKINPVGGCLPMLLQMPIWIALYRTIYSSVELYQAPMGLWIQDLSQPDKYFVLPILLGVSMFLQQRMTPSTMDNAQAKMMLWFMPIMFTVFMLFLPSGLNLYIFVNTLLSILQQWYLKRQVQTPGKTPAKA